MRAIRNLLLLLLSSCAFAVMAQTPPAPVTVTGVAPNQNVRLGNELTVTVSDYAKVRRDAAGKSITLFLNGVDTGITPSGALEHLGQFKFILTRTAENLPLWRVLLRNPFSPDSEKVFVSVGTKGGQPLARSEKDISLLKVRPAPLARVAWSIFLLLVLAGILFFAQPLLQNDHNDRYSLGRVQLAWWFLLILSSYIFIWLLTGDRDTITGSVLVLLGISAATTAASAAINTTVQERRAEKLAALDVHALAVPAAAAALNVQANVIRTAMAAGGPRFFRDLISDDAGRPALHRYQIVVWTTVLGVFFVYSVVTDLTMPQFSDTLLALMGISAGTYIGIKGPTSV